MARQHRRTLPVQTIGGQLVSYEEVDRVLTEGEVRGRAWIHSKARDPAAALLTPTAAEIFELHEVMFGRVFDWAGKPRTSDCGPGGFIHVCWHNVREELHKLEGDAACWVSSIARADVAAIATVVADFHHRFQKIHPLTDTNGRTGRVLDLFLLWRTFGLVGESLELSPVLEYFPAPTHEDEYYDGLAEADLGRPERLRNYYADRIASAIEVIPA